jgi:hypothetical protein
MARKPLMAALLVIVVVAACLGVFLGRGGGDGQVKVAINAQGAHDIGALHVEFGYDPAVLKATHVEEGTLVGNAMMEYNVYDDGWVVVSMIDSHGMNGDGSLVVVTFEVVGEDDEMSSPLTLANVKAWDATDVFEIHLESTSGSFAVEDRSFTAPVIVFSP